MVSLSHRQPSITLTWLVNRIKEISNLMNEFYDLLNLEKRVADIRT